MMPTMRSVLVAAWVGSTNLGDELAFASLVRRLRARDVDVVATSLHPHATESDHDVRAIDHRDPLALTRALSRVDAVVFGGGGLVQNATSPFNLPYHLARPVVARLKRRPVAGIGLGIGPLDGRAATSIARHGLSGVHPITVRDDNSRALLLRLGIESTATADLAFALEPPTATEPDRLVACLRPWSGGRHFLPVAARKTEVPAWFAPAAARALDQASSALGLPVHLVALQRDRDHQVHVKIAHLMRREVTLATPSVHDVLAEISRGVVVVSMRYHGIVSATLAGRPSVAIGYSPKVDALAAQIGRASRLAPWSPSGIEGVTDAVQHVAPNAVVAVEARERLRALERGNDDAIDDLLSR